MLESFPSTVEEYFGPNAQIADVAMVSTDFVAGIRSFKIILETLPAGELPSAPSCAGPNRSVASAIETNLCLGCRT